MVITYSNSGQRIHRTPRARWINFYSLHNYKMLKFWFPSIFRIPSPLSQLISQSWGRQKLFWIVASGPRHDGGLKRLSFFCLKFFYIVHPTRMVKWIRSRRRSITIANLHTLPYSREICTQYLYNWRLSISDRSQLSRDYVALLSFNL